MKQIAPPPPDAVQTMIELLGALKDPEQIKYWLETLAAQRDALEKLKVEVEFKLVDQEKQLELIGQKEESLHKQSLALAEREQLLNQRAAEVSTLDQKLKADQQRLEVESARFYRSMEDRLSEAASVETIAAEKLAEAGVKLVAAEQMKGEYEAKLAKMKKLIGDE